MSKVTFAVIAYHQDFALLDRLLQSIELYCDLNQIDSIKIVLNDPLIYLDNLNAILKKYPNLKIELILAHTLEPRINNGFGWNSQQLFKCLLSEHITPDWYIIHDCKDYYTQPVDLIKDAFTPDGNSWTSETQTQKYEGHAKILLDYVESDPKKDPRWVFYLAQSYRDANTDENRKKSLEWYEKRATMMNGFWEEIYFSNFATFLF